MFAETLVRTEGGL